MNDQTNEATNPTTEAAAPAAEAKAPAKRSPKKDAQTANKKPADKEKAAAAKAKAAEKAKAAKEKAAAKKAADKAKADAKKEAAKAKKAAAKDGVDERLVPARLEEYTVNKEKKTAKGNPSVHCNDDVANLLLGKDLDRVYELAAKTLAKAGIEGASEAELRKRYKNLNVGMQRMNLGNRMRGALALAA